MHILEYLVLGQDFYLPSYDTHLTAKQETTKLKITAVCQEHIK